MNNYKIDREKWAGLSIFEQMGNIASEVGRAMTAMRRGDKERMLAALYRGLDLLDASIEDCAAKKSPKTTEISRAREQFADAILTDKDDPALEQYFMNFAMAARLRGTT
ncbi:MAG TPA: hypothetical protein VFL85_05500 [Candidatus Saccharimonadales bacterium]|nr:hypothetical protein [Candidatus Saccharimonadales bacterium]